MCLGRTLWSQEAAGWAQAVFTLIAILAAAIIANWQRRSEMHEAALERDARGRSAAVLLFSPLQRWLATLDELFSLDGSIAYALHKDSVDHYVNVPVDVSHHVARFADMGDAGVTLQHAAYISATLVHDEVEAVRHWQGPGFMRIDDDPFLADFEERVKLLRSEIRRALDQLATMFES